MAENVTFDLSGGDTLSVPCIPSMAVAGTFLVLGGMEATVQLYLTIRTGNFLTADNVTITVDSDFFTADNSNPMPRPNKLLSFRGRRYRILTAGDDATRAYVRLTLGDPNAR